MNTCCIMLYVCVCVYIYCMSVCVCLCVCVYIYCMYVCVCVCVCVGVPRLGVVVAPTSINKIIREAKTLNTGMSLHGFIAVIIIVINK